MDVADVFVDHPRQCIRGLILIERLEIDRCRAQRYARCVAARKLVGIDQATGWQRNTTAGQAFTRCHTDTLDKLLESCFGRRRGDKFTLPGLASLVENGCRCDQHSRNHHNGFYRCYVRHWKHCHTAELPLRLISLNDAHASIACITNSPFKNCSSRSCSPPILLRMTSHSDRAITIALFCSLTLIWSFSFLLIKVGLESFQPAALVFWRLLIGALVVSAAAWWGGAPGADGRPAR